MKKISYVALVAIGSMAAAAHANLVQNGTFVTTASESTAVTATNVPFWTPMFPNCDPNYLAVFLPGQAATTGASGTSSFVPTFQYTLWSSAPPPVATDNVIAALGSSLYDFGIQQSIQGLTVGQTYQLDFNFAGGEDIAYPAGQPTMATTEAWNVTFGNSSQMTPVLQNAPAGFTGWFADSMQFTATSASQILSFLAVGTPAGDPPTSLLDNVRLTPVTAPVPEPSTWAMLAAGLGVAAFLTRRKGPFKSRGSH